MRGRRLLERTTTSPRPPRPRRLAAAAQARQSGRRRTTTIKVRNTRYGRILFDGNGRALYLFTRERSTKSRCYGQCAVAWPPFYARGKLRAGSGLDADQLGSTAAATAGAS